MSTTFRALAAFVCLALLGVAGPAAAQQQAVSGRSDAGAAVPAKSSAATATDAEARKSEPAKSAGPRDLSAELLAALEDLKKLVSDQGRKIEEQQTLLRQQEERVQQLEAQLQESKAAQTATAVSVPAQNSPKPVSEEDFKLLEGQVEAMADSVKEIGERSSKAQADLAAAQRNYDGKLRQLGNFRFSGDLRFRYEPFIQSQQTTRQRVRVRARLNVQGNISDQLFGGISFATGTLDDPISTNQTLTGFFNRKQIGFDRIFLEYTPRVFKNHVRFGLGKFAFPWLRTTLTFDSDMNPEGIYSRLNWDYNQNPVFKGWTLVGFWLPFNEIGGSTSSTTGIRANGYDNFIAGAQLQTRWQTGSRLRWGLSVAGINFVNPDPIAVAHATGGLTGNTPNTARLRTNASGAVVGYASKYSYLDVLLTSTVNTGRARWPVNLAFNFVNNVRATNRVQIGTAAITAVLPERERSAYFVDVQFGRLSEVKDIQFGYQFYRIERNAVVTAFNESDLRAGSNLIQNRLNFSYQWLNNVSLNYAIWIGRLANAADNISLVPGGKRALAGGPCNSANAPLFTGCTDNYLKRMQFDLVYRF
jgi:hypothetical protein